MTDNPFFIIGTERSGSNLLRLILNSHSRIAVPHPPHIVRFFAPLERAYGDLAGNDRDFAALVHDIANFVSLHIYPWSVKIDRARVLREAAPRDSFGVTIALYEQYRESVGKARWGCKSTFMIEHTDRIRARFPDARLIYLTRDPRDVAASSKKSVFNPFHPSFTAQLWASQQRLGLTLLQQLPAKTILHVRYEDLIAEPADTVARICNSLGEHYEEPMLRYFETSEAHKSASLSRSWANTGRGILAGNWGKYRSELSAAEVRVVEGAARTEMLALGYTPDFPPPPSPSRMDMYAHGLLDLWWRLGVECSSFLSDRNHWRRWARDSAVVYLRLRRRRR